MRVRRGNGARHSNCWVEDWELRQVYDVDVLLRRFREGPTPGRGSLVVLSGIDGLDGYNPSAPVANGQCPHVLVRAEPRHVDYATRSMRGRSTRTCPCCASRILFAASSTARSWSAACASFRGCATVRSGRPSS